MPNRVSEYFQARAVAEQTMANFATDIRVAAAHSNMAERFEQLAREFDIYRENGYCPPPLPSSPV